MAYEKYIKRGGKLYGPYIYHSKRVDGKVVSEYHGQVKKDYKKFVFIGLGILFLIGLIYVFSYYQKGITGHSVLNLDADYREGEILSGKIKLTLQSGELLPKNSKIVFDNNDNKFEYNLNELVFETPISGEFYIKNSSLSGEGEGYGIPGEKIIYPFIDFFLLVESEIEGQTDSVSVREMSGKVSAEEPFVYVFGENEIGAELKPSPTNEKILELTKNENGVTITTSYSEIEEGFGEDYLGDEYKEIIIDISKLELNFEPGNLKLSVLDPQDEIGLISLNTVLGEEQVSTETPSETSSEQEEPSIPTPLESEEIEEPSEETERMVIVPSLEMDLTTNERNLLIEKFGNNFSVKVTEAVEKNGWITIRHELGSYWAENSYVSNLDKEMLNSFIERDRIKWLKDISFSLSQQENSEQNLDEFLGEQKI
ncbi:hypothetical protein FJZ20_02315 [Candidatus Pacearchaeota archaeon]|nr:hypothetical protein [Candidatus Pacearchaeota archaeon]